MYVYKHENHNPQTLLKTFSPPYTIFSKIARNRILLHASEKYGAMTATIQEQNLLFLLKLKKSPRSSFIVLRAEQLLISYTPNKIKKSYDVPKSLSKVCEDSV